MLFSWVKEAGNDREGEMDTDCVMKGVIVKVMKKCVEQIALVERCLGQ